MCVTDFRRPCFALSERAERTLFRTKRSRLIAMLSFCDWPSEPVSEPAKSTRVSLALLRLARPCLVLTLKVQIAWDLLDRAWEPEPPVTLWVDAKAKSSLASTAVFTSMEDIFLTATLSPSFSSCIFSLLSSSGPKRSRMLSL